MGGGAAPLLWCGTLCTASSLTRFTCPPQGIGSGPSGICTWPDPSPFLLALPLSPLPFPMPQLPALQCECAGGCGRQWLTWAPIRCVTHPPHARHPLPHLSLPVFAVRSEILETLSRPSPLGCPARNQQEACGSASSKAAMWPASFLPVAHCVPAQAEDPWKRNVVHGAMNHPPPCLQLHTHLLGLVPLSPAPCCVAVVRPRKAGCDA